jgi:hypothetical protein
MRRGCARDTSAVHGRVLEGAVWEGAVWEGAVRIARETGRPIAQIARALGINAGTRGTGSPGITPVAVTCCGRRVVPHLTAAPGRGARGARALRRGPL